MATPKTSMLLIAALFTIAAALVFTALWPELHRHMYVADCVDTRNSEYPDHDQGLQERRCFLEYRELHGG